MPFPSPPWQLAGVLWLSVFAVRGGTADRPAGLYGAAFVDYSDEGVLSYRELLVARLVRDGMVPRVTVTDIWVDSVASRDGGRALWAIPKELADLHVDDRRAGPLSRTGCSARIRGGPVAEAMFSTVRGAVARAPYAFTVAQTRDTGERVVTGVSGSAKPLVAHARWRFGSDGPLAWLAGHHPVATFRLNAVRLTFG